MNLPTYRSQINRFEPNSGGVFLTQRVGLVLNATSLEIEC